MPSSFAPITGRYVYLEIQGHTYRVFFEEAGEGIPLILQHTACADSRQWRHLLEDPEITAQFRLIAADMPYHGKSIPPEDLEWWTSEYSLTQDFFEEYLLKLCAGLELDRPAYMGCSMGGHMAVDLAIDHPDDFRALIGLEAGMETEGTAPPEMLDWFYHPRLSNEFKPSLMYTMMAPQSPENLRRETVFVYTQGAPQVFKGDLNYYGIEHDVTETARTIDTEKVGFYILGGEYDWSGTPEVCEALHEEVKGSRYTRMEKLGHFPMCENPEAFKAYLMPVLDDIRRRSGEDV
jgi:pimeloyl-ACP methyl ester carboxylesterase